jgi:hypothetical protein
MRGKRREINLNRSSVARSVAVELGDSVWSEVEDCD